MNSDTKHLHALADLADVADRYASTVGQAIRSARQSAGVSQAELARRIGAQQPIIARWESGAVVPRIDALRGIIAALQADA
jgi:ribosome-binding protein aMBF1 (putative translation factor)